MKRRVEDELFIWRDQSERCPLIVRGARQVGKSHLVEGFGAAAFDDCVVINFEFESSYESCFASLDPVEILRKIALYRNRPIIPGKTLLFLDEIQRCPRAIMSLRYFKEKLPDLHVIAAGSLLEFALADEKFSFPVGRIEYLYLRPMSFHEFLGAMGRDLLVNEIGSWRLDSPPDAELHRHCLDLLRSYLFVGGMPAVVKIFQEEGDFLRCERRQSALMKTYRDDFGKYSSQLKHKYLQRVLERSPYLVGHHFQYSKIEPDFRSRDLKAAVEQLAQAGLLVRVHATAANGLPLRAERSERKFKVLGLDVGLVQFSLGHLASEQRHADLLEIHRGALTEQFVGQELLAYSDCYLEKHLHFWERAKKSSSAEVDYVVNIEGRILPIEVKAGATGRLRSMQLFLEEKGHPLGVRISQHPLELSGNILSVPLYMVSELPRLIREVL